MSHVVFVGPQPASQRPFLRGLERVGATVTGVGTEAPESLDAELRYSLDGYEQVPSLLDEDAVYAAVQRVQDRGPPISAFECTLEPYLEGTARVRERCAIPGTPAKTVSLTRDKLRLKEYLRARDVHASPAVAMTSDADTRAFAAQHGFPLIVKPRDGTGLSGIHAVPDASALDAALAAVNPAAHPGAFGIERFAIGHESFFDGLVVNGEIAFEAATHFYPSVLEALTNRHVVPKVVHTNRIDHAGYDELRLMHRRVVGALSTAGHSLGTTATHTEWFNSADGLWFSELGLHPPPCSFWDLYSEAGDFDLYTAWASAICGGQVERRSARLSAGLVNLRPSQDGTITGYDGIEAMQRRYGKFIFRMQLPPAGSPTEPIASGYLANAFVCLKHPDYDALRTMLDEVGDMVTVHAT